MKKHSLKSLSIRLPLLFVASVIVLMIIVIPLVYSRFHSRMIDQYQRMAEGVTRLMVNAIDGDRVDEYLEHSFELEEYVETVEYFKTLKDNYPDVLYLYVCRFEEGGGRIIIDLDAEGVENGEAYEVGYVYELEEPFASLAPDIMAGKKTPGYAAHTQEDGYLYSYIRPIYRSDGSYACSACVDFSMDYLSHMDIAFTLRLSLILLGIAALILFLDILVVRRRITQPIDRLSLCAGKFAYDTEQDRKNNIELLESVRIHTGDEIEDVYRVLQSVTRDSFLATANLTQAKLDILDKDEQLSQMSIKAYRDNLTGVGNLTAYKQEAQRLEAEIREGSARFALVMFDLNDLKRVNDTCGHSFGDAYIRGCCQTICAHYRHSPVFRIGGDEFVVVLREEDYRNREALFRQTCAAFEQSQGRATRNIWEKYSASGGMAVYGEQGDTVEKVLSRADEAMYAAKRRFKKGAEARQ